MKRTIEIVEYFEASASITAHAGISFIERGSLPADFCSAITHTLVEHKDCQTGDSCVGR
jgi:hypothetical protein